ncbi:hypothetical protein LINPERPRIM_LOCUS6308 [Linum perenne]
MELSYLQTWLWWELGYDPTQVSLKRATPRCMQLEMSQHFQSNYLVKLGGWSTLTVRGSRQRISITCHFSTPEYLHSLGSSMETMQEKWFTSGTSQGTELGTLLDRSLREEQKKSMKP